jgi:hypothetical protein
MEKKLGWRKDKYDHRDFLHPTAKVVPPSADLKQYIPPIRDQGQEGSCVGFGIGGNICSVAKQLGIFTQWYSPRYIYNGARYMEGTLMQDVGCEPGDALAWSQKMGCLLEKYWLYVDVPLDTSAPSSKREKEAVKYPKFTYTRCVDGFDGICSALAAGHIVSIGTPWPQKWMEPVKGLLPEVVAGDFGGEGHETFLYKYDKTQVVYSSGVFPFFGANSWGTAWGDQGLYVMPSSAFEVMKQVGGYDAYIITFNKPKKKCIF